MLRGEAGKPGPAAELTSDYTPLEVGYFEAISKSKGCYTGQEIIARQLTYDKVTRQLTGIKLKEYIEPGAVLKVADKSIGTLTSVVHSPRFGIIGLCLVRKGFEHPGQELTVVNSHNFISAEFSNFPFN